MKLIPVMAGLCTISDPVLLVGIVDPGYGQLGKGRPPNISIFGINCKLVITRTLHHKADS